VSARSAWNFGLSHAPVSAFLSTLHLEPKPQYRRVDTNQFAKEVNSLRSTNPISGVLPDIVVFLQESQFNLRAIAQCPPALCSLGIFDTQATTTDHGELRVHVFGGGTWLSEFSLATGLPHTIFGRAGDFASFNVAPGIQRSFVQSLKAAGYYTVAVYPVGGGMMNARAAYQAYGFDEFLDAGDLRLAGGFTTPDKLLHEAAVRTLHLAQRRAKPVFLLAVTVFNHSQHGIRMDRVPVETRRAADRVFDERTEADNLGDFIWRTQEFEKAYRASREAILGSDRRSLVAWFGDHQPPFGDAPRLRGSIKSQVHGSKVPDQFLTWYSVETNFPPPAAEPQSPQLDIVFLPGLLAQRRGVPLDEWLAANVVARGRCGGLLIECPDPAWRDAYYTYLLDDLRASR
jgi:hypothetical protein